MDLDEMQSLFKNYNSAMKKISKNEGVLQNVVDKDNISNNSSNDPSVKKIPMRCCIESCKKKLTLCNNFTCDKCDKTKTKLYCTAHRMPEDHACTAPQEQIKLIKVAGDGMRGDRV
jgi:hypothetical protein